MSEEVIIDKNTGRLNNKSRSSQQMPLIVNLAGKVSITKPFLTYNTKGRLDYYLLYITEGKMSVTVENEVKIASVGDFVIFPPKYKYKYGLTEGNVEYYFVHFTGSHVDKYLSKLAIGTPPCICHAGYGEEIGSAFSSFFSSNDLSDEFSSTISSVEFLRVLALLAKVHHFGDSRSPISHSLAYINGHYTEEIRITDLAAMEGLSVSRYNAVFRDSVGVSPIKYIINLRMHQACTLLDGTDLTVKQISEMVGYTDNHFFSKLFKSYIGLSPTVYRGTGSK